MKRLTMMALVAAQLTMAAQPAIAAELTETRTQQMGAFAGFRLRVPLDGNAGERQIRAGLAVAPAMHSRTLDGETRLRIGEGVELGVAERQKLRLSVAGTPVSQLTQGPVGPDGQRLGVSNVGWIAIGAGIVIAGLGLAWIVIE